MIKMVILKMTARRANAGDEAEAARAVTVSSVKMMSSPFVTSAMASPADGPDFRLAAMAASLCAVVELSPRVIGRRTSSPSSACLSRSRTRPGSRSRS
jgi:hypothetical protein